MSATDTVEPSGQSSANSGLDAMDAAFRNYYDSASDEELEEQLAWAQMVGPNVVIGVDWDGNTE